MVPKWNLFYLHNKNNKYVSILNRMARRYFLSRVAYLPFLEIRKERSKKTIGNVIKRNENINVKALT